MHALSRLFRLAATAIVVLGLTSSGFAAGEMGSSRIPAPFLGAWKCKATPEELIRLEPERVVQFSKGTLKVWGVERYEPEKLIVRSGLLHKWRLSLAGDALKLENEREAHTCSRLPEIPSELDVQPLQFGQPGELASSRIEAVRAELAARIKKDQEVRTNPERASELAAVDADNRQYIRSLVTDLGWIDVDRFGPRASVNAFLLVQHSGDLRLMMAALPWIEKDARRYPDYAQPYSLLYDRVQIDLGKKQRYGTQLGKDSEGNPMVLPLEDSAHVDEFLKELKLPPLSDYLATASKYIYQDKPIRMPKADE